MPRFLMSLIMVLSLALPLGAEEVPVYRRIPSERVKATASSSIPGSPASNAVNWSGMTDRGHVANNLGEGMWVSEPARRPVRYSSGTARGAVWFLCELASADAVDQVRIWNHNQNEHTRRGFRKVFIDYSLDGRRWSRLAEGEKDYHVIPESKGRNPEPADYVLDLKGLKFKYFCITAAMDGGNYYDMSDPAVAVETKDMLQNPAYYGLAEISFWKLGKEDVGKLEPLSGVSLAPSQGYLRTGTGPRREFSLGFDHPVYAGARIDFSMDGKTWSETIEANPSGVSERTFLFPAGDMEESSRLGVSVRSPQGNVSSVVDIPAARKWTVDFFPHSHVDIGYTHRQDEVMRLQWRNFERAMDLAEKTKDYPDGARFKWNTETTWAVMGYLNEYAGTPKADRVIAAVKSGVINVNAALGSILTGVSRQEELMHIFDDAHRIEEITGVKCSTAMMSDVPGQAWGLATAMAQNGVRYYSPGPNYVPFYGRIGNDRAAALHVKWGDRPFWWQSQSGTDKVLVFEAGRGYSWFHGWLEGRLSVCGLEPIWRYLEQLETEEYPYNLCYLRYTVHGDNGPPDQLMPDVIRKWNETYDSPTFRIATAQEFFEDFEKNYGEELPVVGGDMTPTWEDGAASTARETAMNRESASRLAQTQILWSMLKPSGTYPDERFEEAYKNVVLFSEHTWGASASGPQPFSKFTLELWDKKKSFADSADVQSRRLMDEAVSGFSSKGRYIHVVNTNLWARTDAVRIDSGLMAGNILTDDSGTPVPFQNLSDGTCVFVAEDVPALGSKVFRISPADGAVKMSPQTMIADGNVLDNGLVRVVIDRERGTISSLRKSTDDFEYASEDGLNDFLYTARVGADPRGIGKVTSVEILENGPVAATVRVISDAPGCNNLTRDVTVYAGIDRVDIVNTIDKKDVLDFENVRFVFPFNFPHPDITFDLAMSEVHPEREQLAGVNKQYYCVQNGLSVGDLEHGIYLTTIDAPMVELGTPSGEDYRLNPHYGYGWWPMSQISPKVYSWVMTNTWRTNYKASQGGVAVFRYSLRIGNPLDLELKKTGLEAEQRMLAVTSDESEPLETLFRLRGRNRVSVSMIKPSKDGKGYVVALQNMGGNPVRTGLVSGRMAVNSAWTTDFNESELDPIDQDDFWIRPYQYVRLKINCDIR